MVSSRAAIPIVLSAVVLLVFSGCTKTQDREHHEASGQSDSAPGYSQGSAASQGSASTQDADTADASQPSANSGAAGSAQAGTADRTPAPAPSLPPVPSEIGVPVILASPAYVGQTIRVSGKCLGYGKNMALGTSPLTRSDWQLEDAGSAIWVSGPLPEGCSPTEGSTVRSTIRARVEEDTLHGLGGQAPKARRYLVRVDR